MYYNNFFIHCLLETYLKRNNSEVLFFKIQMSATYKLTRTKLSSVLRALTTFLTSLKAH